MAKERAAKPTDLSKPVSSITCAHKLQTTKQALTEYEMLKTELLESLKPSKTAVRFRQIQDSLLKSKNSETPFTKAQEALIEQIYRRIIKHEDYALIQSPDRPFLQEYIGLYVSNPAKYPVVPDSNIHRLIHDAGSQEEQTPPDLKSGQLGLSQKLL